MKTIITGYAGFIGSNLTRALIGNAMPGDQILGIDCHTYAARPLWVWDMLDDADSRFIEANVDIRNPAALSAIIENFGPDQVYHLAAESHVCRSIQGPRDFATTNFMGTFNLLEALRSINFKGRLVHVSTDEAFGELRHGDEPFSEQTPTDPTSPYSASKAASDLMVKAYVRTYGMAAMITRCSNNFGPNQHEEKLIPKTILKVLNNEPIVLYGDGSHIRDWIYVDDHCRALVTVMEKGTPGHLYCIGGEREYTNKDIAFRVARAVEEITRKNYSPQIEYTNDRPTDDTRYAIDAHKLKSLGWAIDSDPTYFRGRLQDTVRWYMGEMQNENQR